jgi:hypothetical protein
VDKYDFFIKVEDDYYYLCYGGKCILCDKIGNLRKLCIVNLFKFLVMVRYFEKKVSGIILEKGYYRNDDKIGYWEYYHNNGNLYYVSFGNINWLNNKWYKLDGRELNKIGNYVLLEERYVNLSCYYYKINGSINFISKLDDDYYYLFSEGVYKRCDQLWELIREIKRLKIN